MEKNNKVILVPFDFTEVADYAVSHAANISKCQGWEIHLLHIINKDTRALLNVYRVDDALVNERLNECAKEYEAKYNVPVSFEAREGSIFTDIAKAAEETKAAFVVMGTHGKQGMQYLLGSHAHKVITSTNVPFIVVQKKDHKNEGFSRIVTPLDDTIESRQKIKWAIYIAKEFDATLYIKVMYRSDDLYRAKMKVVLSKIEEILKKNEVKFESEYVQDSASQAKQVIDYSNKVEADLILIITNPESFLLSSTDEQIIFNESMIPVMTVNPRDINITVVGL